MLLGLVYWEFSPLLRKNPLKNHISASGAWLCSYFDSYSSFYQVFPLFMTPGHPYLKGAAGNADFLLRLGV